MQHVDEALSAAHASVSLNQTVGADDEGELGDLFADREAADPFEEAEESLRRQGVRRALDALPERERRILELRFGFEGEPWTLEAIGHELDLTRETRPPARGTGARAPRRAARPDPRRRPNKFRTASSERSGRLAPFFAGAGLRYSPNPQGGLGGPCIQGGNLEGEKVFASRPSRLDRDRAAPRHRGGSQVRGGRHCSSSAPRPIRSYSTARSFRTASRFGRSTRCSKVSSA